MEADHTSNLQPDNLYRGQDIAGQYIQNSNAQLRQRLSELALLNDISQTLVSTFDLEVILNTVTCKLVNFFGIDTCGVALLNAERTALTVVAEYDRTNTDSAVGLVLPLAKNPLSVRVIETRKPNQLSAKDVAPETSLSSDMVEQRQVQCLLVTPLISKGEVIGTVGLATGVLNRMFTAAEMSLVETVAGQVAGAIVNARLFEQERRQRQMAESLQAVATVLNSSLDLQTVLKKILEQLGNVIQHDGAAVFLRDGEDLVITAGAKLAEAFVGVRIPRFSRNPAARVFRSNTAFVIPDVELDFGWEKWPDGAPIRCWMGAPLAVSGRVIGVLSADNFNVGAYSDKDQQILETFANQAATAIRNAQQINQVEEALHETQLLYRVTSILAKTPDTQQGVEKALGEFLQVLGLKQGGISLFDLERQTGYLYVLYRHGRPQKPTAEAINFKSKAYQYIIETGRSLAVYDAYNEPLLFENRNLTIAHNIKSMLFTPLILRGEVIGVLGADTTDKYRHFSEREQNLAQAVADSIVTTLQNARLLEQEQRQRQVAESLSLVAAILNSHLDHREVLRKILEQLGRVVQYDGAGILLQQGDQLVLAAGTNLADGFVGSTVPFTKSDPAVRVVKNKRALHISDVHQDPYWEIWSGGESIRGWLGVPLITSKGVIGALTVDSATVGAYTESDANVLQLFANQAAIAIENANLVREYLQAKEAAEAASNAKSVFLASVSHELRTPLNGILGFAQILKMDSQLTPDQLEGVDVIEQSGQHLLSLINDILDLAKVESGKLELNYADFNLIEFLSGICRTMQLRAEFKNINFSCNANAATRGDNRQPTLPAVVYGDEIRLRQVIINLLGNAIKFTDRGQVNFNVNRIDDGADPAACKIRFEVEDTGLGIPPEELGRIFEPFSQAGDYKQKAEGTGLGLAICRNLVEKMDSKLQVASILGKGSRFWFEITLPASGDAAIHSVVDTSHIVGIKGLPPKILVVSKSVENRHVIAGMLVPLGCQIIEAVDGYDGVEKTVQQQPAAVIADLNMPGMSGLELIQRLRQTPGLQEVVIIIMSGSGQETDRQQCLAAGCNAFIFRPVRIGRLYFELQQHLGLEWFYTEAEPAEVAPQFVAPLRDQLVQLIELARIGDIRQIKRYLDQLEAEDAQFQPFVSQANALLKGFQLEKLRAFLESL